MLVLQENKIFFDYLLTKHFGQKQIAENELRMHPLFYFFLQAIIPQNKSADYQPNGQPKAYHTRNNTVHPTPMTHVKRQVYRNKSENPQSGT